MRLERLQKRLQEARVLCRRRVGVPPKYLFDLAVHVGQNFGRRRGPPLSKQMGDLKVLDAGGFRHFHVAIQLVKAEAHLPATHRHIDQLHGGPLPAHRRVQRRGKHRRQQQVDAIRRRVLHILAENGPVLLGKRFHSVPGGQTVRVEPFGMYQRLWGKRRADDLHREGYLDLLLSRRQPHCHRTLTRGGVIRHHEGYPQAAPLSAEHPQLPLVRKKRIGVQPRLGAKILPVPLAIAGERHRRLSHVVQIGLAAEGQLSPGGHQHPCDLRGAAGHLKIHPFPSQGGHARRPAGRQFLVGKHLLQGVEYSYVHPHCPHLLIRYSKSHSMAQIIANSLRRGLTLSARIVSDSASFFVALFSYFCYDGSYGNPSGGRLPEKGRSLWRL